MTFHARWIWYVTINVLHENSYVEFISKYCWSLWIPIQIDQWFISNWILLMHILNSCISNYGQVEGSMTVSATKFSCDPDIFGSACAIIELLSRHVQPDVVKLTVLCYCFLTPITDELLYMSKWFDELTVFFLLNLSYYVSIYLFECTMFWWQAMKVLDCCCQYYIIKIGDQEDGGICTTFGLSKVGVA